MASTAEVEQGVDLILSRMTPSEKIAQMMMVREDFINPDDIEEMGYGAILVRPTPDARPGVENAADWADRYDARVRASLDSRLGIPLLVGVDAVHGHALAAGATVFPHNVGLGAVRNAELLRQMGQAVADEARATGCNWILAPAVSVSRDIRWGRTYEGWGEHPQTQEGKVKHFIEGAQEGGRLPVIATAKHFLGDGAATWGTSPKGPNNIDQGNAEISEHELRELHLPPFREALEAGVGSVMVGYHQWNGEEAHHSRYLLTTLLKEELEFDGFVVSDATGFFEEGQDFSERSLSAAKAGIDLFMLTNSELWEAFHPAMIAHLENGDLSIDRVDDAVRRILRIKLRHGLFEHPYADRWLTENGALGASQHREVARKLARESLVLLQNKQGLIPLAKDVKIGVTGPSANDVGLQCGGWTYQWGGVTMPESEILSGVSVLEGIRSHLEPTGGEVVYEPLWGDLPAKLDVVVYALGEEPYAEWFGDSENPSIPLEDIEAIESLQRQLEIPVVVVVLSGRPLSAGTAPLEWEGLVFAGLPGTEGGLALADCLFGEAPFTGRLTHSWPVSAEDLPTNAGNTDDSPLFDFGSGLQTIQKSHRRGNPGEGELHPALP